MVKLLEKAISISWFAWTVTGNTIDIGITRKSSPSLEQAVQAASVRIMTLSADSKGSLNRAENIPLIALYNAQYSYYIKVGLGTPSQNFSLVLDTGSSLLWVPDKTCGGKCVNAPHFFDRSNSATFKQDYSTNFQAGYGSGRAQGIIGFDTLSFNDGSFKVENQEFGLATDQNHITNNGNDGIFGLGPDPLSAYGNTAHKVIATPITNLVKQNKDLSTLFSVRFAPVPKGSYYAMNGFLSLGGLPDRKWYKGELQWVPRIRHSPAAFMLRISNFGEWLLILSTDIGTTLIIVSHEIANAFFSEIPGAIIDPFTEYWGVPCQSVNKLSTITFTIGGVELSLTPEEYMIPTYLMRDNLYQNRRPGTCLSFIHGFDTSGLGCDMLLGQKFLERYVTVYDPEQNKIAFARSNPNA
ncbi:hypothetical protein INT43_003219 [Umbelopsis isabellina]|uniref:Peptidase A1 domain-containing protein n=1 Tax=Mortierella isabellina TaxID=91625 RepID=A0A8H7PPP8_MORIS|nr:hypothetical protein INT43_003219 [Umbelopsis isabellina]